jgi:hypothetical protein
MDINSIKSIKPGSNLPKKVLAVIISVFIVAVSFIFLNNVSSDAKEVIEITVVRSSGGIPARTLITKDMIARGTILKQDFNKDMILYENAEEILNKYSAYFLRNETPIYYDQLTAIKPIKNEWLYELPQEKEVVTIPYDYNKCGGDILTPGDYIRVRITYEAEEVVNVQAGEGEPPYLTARTSTKRATRTEIIFDRILVKDMLNSKGHSIYEVYQEVLKLSEEKRQAAMTSKEFMQSVLAKSLVLEASDEQVNKYATYNGDNCTFTFTILSRDGNDNLIEQLPTVQKEVETWINGKKD